MNKKLIALAVAGALGLPAAALAQGTNVTIYGTLNVDFERVEAEDSFVGPELEARNRVSSNSSNIGFRGTEDLGNGLKAIFQCESSANIDNGGAGFCTRNTHVGLSGGWGTLFYGQWDTPYKFTTLAQDAWYATGIAASATVIGTPAFGVATATASGTPGTFGATPANASFDVRRGDSVQYWSPNWAGFAFRVMYSANEGKSSDPPGAAPGVVGTGTAEVDPYTWGGAITYTNGPIYLNAAYERHIDFFGLNQISGFGVGAAAPSAANDSSRDTGIKVGAGYRFGNTTLNVIWERLKYENDNGVGATPATQLEEFERDLIYVSLLHRIGNWTLRAYYAKADEAECDLSSGAACILEDDTGADAWAVGASYSLSKRTDLYGLFTRVDNDDRASYTFGVNGLRPAGAFGFENNGIALGIRHSF
jgi:predicted porin